VRQPASLSADRRRSTERGWGGKKASNSDRIASKRVGMSHALRVLRVLGLGLALVSLQSSCAFDAFTPTRVPAEQRAAYDAAMGHLPADPAAATAGLEAFLTTYPKSLLADDAAEQIANLAFLEGRDEEGMAQLALILKRYPAGDRANAVRLRLAQFEYARDRRTPARALLGALDIEKLPRTEQRAALRLRVALSRTPVERMKNLVSLRAKLADEADERRSDVVSRDRLATRLATVDREIETLISSAAGAELDDMLQSLHERPPAGAILLELSRRSLDAGQLDLASTRLEDADTLIRSDLERAEWLRLTDRLTGLLEAAQADADMPPLRELADRARPRTAGAQGTLGVVLPLSGEFGAFGQESLRGILLATGLFTSDEVDAAVAAAPDPAQIARAATDRRRERGIRLLVRDTEGDPVRASAAVRELAANPEIVAIVGPIFSAESLGAAEAAEAGGVPLVTLSTKEEVPVGRTQVFRTRTTPGDEVGALVAYAFDQLGAKRFAVLYPESRYGRGMRKLYWDAVRARGGKMVAVSSYDPDATDFSESIRDMIGWRFLTDAERKALSQRDELMKSIRGLEPTDQSLLREAAYDVVGPEGDPLPPIVDFDVLFIPDTSEKVALIAPGLAFNEIVGVRLLGSSEWLDEDLLRAARQHVSGAVISTPFYPESDVSIVAEFVAAYRKTFGEMPGAYAAQAFDATNLILVQLAAGRVDRREVREGLIGIRAYPGATGVLTMRPNGNARRRPFLLGVSGRRFRSLD
jgi:ABC-type branched-subunit amino acid transport system substrate-binding protein